MKSIHRAMEELWLAERRRKKKRTHQVSIYQYI